MSKCFPVCLPKAAHTSLSVRSKGIVRFHPVPVGSGCARLKAYP